MQFDPLLKMIAEISTKLGDSSQGRFETGITLQIGGLLVTGNIISARQYFLEHPLTDKILEVKEVLDKTDPLAEQPDKDGPHFVHLSGARYFIPGQPPIPTQGEGVYWRGRLSEVAGFSFGILAVDDGGHHDT